MNSILLSIMQSIKPFHCENIAIGRKGYEVRKTKPNISSPFKSYIYCTKPKSLYDWGLCIDLEIQDVRKYFKINKDYLTSRDYPILDGKVIGEYICDEIQEWVFDNETNSYDISDDDLVLTCLTQEQLWEYGKGKTLYGYHISDLKFYDEPKDLSRFGTKCNLDCPSVHCPYWKYQRVNADEWDYDCSCNNIRPLTRPPQSWCYVEEV
ncbi:MAG: hypothetical protein K2J59_08335 [Eubacterium sp.]|nr:hypothetical protein [Eubacterium sp.]MDE6752760.1 hypothetical protein [Eubacterium sp.]